MCVRRKRVSGCGELKGGFFWFCEKGGIQFYTVENLARNVPDRGHSGSDPPPRRRGKKEEPRPMKSGQTDGSTAIDNPVSQWETGLGRQMCGVYQ